MAAVETDCETGAFFRHGVGCLSFVVVLVAGLVKVRWCGCWRLEWD